MSKLKIKRDKNQDRVLSIEMKTKKTIIILSSYDEIADESLVTGIRYDAKRDDLIFSGINLITKNDVTISLLDFSDGLHGSEFLSFANENDHLLAAKEIGKLSGLAGTDPYLTENEQTFLQERISSRFHELVHDFVPAPIRVSALEKFNNANDKVVEKAEEKENNKNKMLDPILE